MSFNRWAAKRDTGEIEIVDALRKAGALVLHLNKFDLLIYYRGQLFMRDTKSKDGRITDAQQQLLDDGWPLVFFKDPIEALRSIGAVR
jgi:hypothetical protein